MLTERDLSIVEHLYRYYVLSRGQIQRLCFEKDASGRVCRRRLQTLVEGQFVRRLPLLLAPPGTPNASSQGSVYYPALRGLELLAEYRDDERFLLGTTRTPQMHRLWHWLAVSETHMALDAAIRSQSGVICPQFYNEWDIVNKDATAPEQRFRLYLLLQEKPRLVCAPDAAFLIDVAGLRKVFYLEQDRNTSSATQAAASKSKGYAVMAERQLQRRHFPDENVGAFSFLVVAPCSYRRDALRKAFRDQPGSKLWKFAAEQDVTAEKFLFEPVFYPCEGEASALVNRKSLPRVVEATAVKRSANHV